MKRTTMIALLALTGCGGGSGDPATQPVAQEAKAEPVVVAVAPTVVFFGDSIVARWPLPASITNAGVGGNTTLLLLDRFQRDVLDKRPALVVLEGGVNDLDREWPVADVANNMAALIIRAQAAGARVVLLACLPTKYPHIRAAALNVELKAVAASYGVTFVDTYSPFLAPDGVRLDLLPDGVHPNEAGYVVLWEAVRHSL